VQVEVGPLPGSLEGAALGGVLLVVGLQVAQHVRPVLLIHAPLRCLATPLSSLCCLSREQRPLMNVYQYGPIGTYSHFKGELKGTFKLRPKSVNRLMMSWARCSRWRPFSGRSTPAGRWGDREALVQWWWGGVTVSTTTTHVVTPIAAILASIHPWERKTNEKFSVDTGPHMI